MIYIVYEDDDILIVDKPQGVATTPGKIEDICSALFEIRPELSLVSGYKKGEGGLLNRLDNETGGLVLFSKNDASFCYYHERFKSETIKKEYIALVDGLPALETGVINTPIAHHYSDTSRMVAVNGKTKYRSTPQNAVTEYKVLTSEKNISLLHVVITKGVRHQIRVHLASIGCPIAGDKIYNKRKSIGYEFQMLFAYAVTIPTKTGIEKRIVKIPDFVVADYPIIKDIL